MTKKAVRFGKTDWRTWGAGDRIPQNVLERMVALPDFDVNVVRRAAESRLRRVRWSYVDKEIYKELLGLRLEFLNPDPALDNVYTLGGILEYAFIVIKVENMLGNRLGPENLSAEDVEELVGFRESLEAVKTRMRRAVMDE